MFDEHTWNHDRFDSHVQEGLDLVKGRVLFLQRSDGERTHAIIPFIGWLALEYLRKRGVEDDFEEREVMMRLQDGARELRIYVGTSPETVATAIRAFRNEQDG